MPILPQILLGHLPPEPNYSPSYPPRAIERLDTVPESPTQDRLTRQILLCLLVIPIYAAIFFYTWYLFRIYEGSWLPQSPVGSLTHPSMDVEIGFCLHDPSAGHNSIVSDRGDHGILYATSCLASPGANVDGRAWKFSAKGLAWIPSCGLVTWMFIIDEHAVLYTGTLQPSLRPSPPVEAVIYFDDIDDLTGTAYHAGRILDCDFGFTITSRGRAVARIEYCGLRQARMQNAHGGGTWVVS